MTQLSLESPAIRPETLSRRLYRRLIAPVLASRAAWFFAGVWVLSALALAATGNAAQLPIRAVFFAGLLLFCALTVLITAPDPTTSAAVPAERPRLWLQLAITLAVILITGYTALAFHQLIPRSAAQIPLWSALMRSAAAFGERWLPVELVGSPANAITNPLAYFVLPLAALLLAGARPAQLGLAPGQRSGRAILLWASIPLGMWLVALLTGQLTLGRLGRRMLSNALQNGFFEEFLFRGALQTRLRALWRADWALVLQALVFGLWHLGADTRLMGGDFAAGLAMTILIQASMGIAFGLLLQRTRSLLAPSAVHIVINSLSL